MLVNHQVCARFGRAVNGERFAAFSIQNGEGAARCVFHNAPLLSGGSVCDVLAHIGVVRGIAICRLKSIVGAISHNAVVAGESVVFHGENLEV